MKYELKQLAKRGAEAQVLRLESPPCIAEFLLRQLKYYNF